MKLTGRLGILFKSNLDDFSNFFTISAFSLFGGVLIMAESLFSTLIWSGLPSRMCIVTFLENF